MSQTNPNNGTQGKGDSVSRRVADELHDRIDKAAEKSEKFEHNLHERGAQASDKAREMNSGLTRVARENPWAVIGGSVALGVLIGALASRR